MRRVQKRPAATGAGPGGGEMSTIDRVEIHGFTYEVPNLGLPEHGAQGVGNWVYQKGSKVRASRYAVRIRTDDGLRRRIRHPLGGHPVRDGPEHHARPASARPRSREPRADLRRSQARAARLRPHGPWPARHRAVGPRRQEVRRAGRASAGRFSYAACRPTPAPITARTSRAAWTARRRSPTSPKPAKSSATRASRSTAGTTATAGARRGTCSACARASATTWR